MTPTVADKTPSESISWDLTIHVNHYMARQNPLFRAFNAWNELPVRVRNAENKEVFKSLYMLTIVNPYKK